MTVTMRSLSVLALALGLSGLVPVSLAAEEPTYIYAPDGIALSGYDAVSYFLLGHPVRGTPENALMWRGATWYFVSPESEQTFEMNPGAYAPQFGGYCAYSVSEGKTASGAPGAFFVYKGRLYLMHEEGMVEQMQSRIPAIVTEAEDNWPAVLGR